tara:strand:+ start:98 stop:328 length:231 start_codon:yes stop_codon:yes gene_type:complete
MMPIAMGMLTSTPTKNVNPNNTVKKNKFINPRPLPTAGMFGGPSGPIAGMENYRTSLNTRTRSANMLGMPMAGMFM